LNTVGRFRALLWLRERVAKLETREFALMAAAIAVYFGGIVARGRYILVSHHPRHHATTDAGDLLEVATRLLQRADAQTIHDTIWPPGAPSLLALAMLGDATLGVAAVVQFAMSALIPLLIAHTTLLAAGRRAAYVALLLASLHFGFVHYAGYFLSELAFQFAATLAVWASVLSLRLAESLAPAARPGNEVLVLILLGGAAGVAWGFATYFRPNALAMALLIGGALLARFVRRNQRCYLPLLAGAALGFALVLAPLAHRCTSLKGSFCPVSNNIAMNMVLGQAGEVKGLTFRNTKRPELTTGWVPPALLHHGYEAEKEVPFSIYDTGPALAWLGERLVKNPGEFLVRIVGNWLDLFRFEYWPDDYGSLPERSASVMKQAFLLFVVAPGLFGAWLLLRDRRKAHDSAVPGFLLATFGALSLVAAFSMGEPRYRIPFDGVFVLLAASLFTRAAPGSASFALRPEGRRVPALLLPAAIGCAGLVSAAIVAVSHPAVGAATRLRTLFADRATSGPQRTSPAASYAKPPKSETPWDAAQNYRFVCKPRCPELVLLFGELQRADEIELSTDNNDWYGLTFYRRSGAVGYTAVVRRPGGHGLKTSRVRTPDDARDGFDAVGVVPLFGDGRYALGHVRVIGGTNVVPPVPRPTRTKVL
jgi:hypothetical protein